MRATLSLDFAKAGSRSIDDAIYQFQVCLSSPSRKALAIEEDACVNRFACPGCAEDESNPKSPSHDKRDEGNSSHIAFNL